MNQPRPAVRCVIYDARNFAALTVAALRPEVYDHLLHFDSPYQITVEPPLPMPTTLPESPVDYAKRAYRLYTVSLRGVLFRVSAHQTFTMIVTDTPDTAVLLGPELLPGQRRRSEEEIYRDAFEAGERHAIRRMNQPPRG